MFFVCSVWYIFFFCFFFICSMRVYFHLVWFKQHVSTVLCRWSYDLWGIIFKAFTRLFANCLKFDHFITTTVQSWHWVAKRKQRGTEERGKMFCQKQSEVFASTWRVGSGWKSHQFATEFLKCDLSNFINSIYGHRWQCIESNYHDTWYLTEEWK